MSSLINSRVYENIYVHVQGVNDGKGEIIQKRGYLLCCMLRGECGEEKDEVYDDYSSPCRQCWEIKEAKDTRCYWKNAGKGGDDDRCLKPFAICRARHGGRIRRRKWAYPYDLMEYDSVSGEGTRSCLYGLFLIPMPLRLFIERMEGVSCIYKIMINMSTKRARGNRHLHPAYCKNCRRSNSKDHIENRLLALAMRMPPATPMEDTNPDAASHKTSFL